jgi:hypothetical protein
MDMRKAAVILVSILLAFGFNFMYNSSIIYWDGYAYEISQTNDIDLNSTIQLTSQDLATYPDLAVKLDEAGQAGSAMMTFEEGDAIHQYEDLVESRRDGTLQDMMFLQTEDQSYAVNFTMYGGMDDQPIYLWLSWLFGLVAVGLVLSGAVGYLRNKI